MRSLISILFFIFLIAGCQYKPTKIVSEDSVVPSGVHHLSADKIMAAKPVILDARSPFEFNLSHVPGAVNVRWEDFSQTDTGRRGLLQTDYFSLARRLSLIGIDPDSKIVVLGKGGLGAGEEGRIAWTLKVLGIKDVYTLVHTSYRAMNPKDEPVAIRNKPYWKPLVREDLNISLGQFNAVLGNLNTKSSGIQLFGKPLTQLQHKIVILDVRSTAEMSLQNLIQKNINKIPVVNIEWFHFFGEDGLPFKTNISKLLESQGIVSDNVIIVISNHGVRSAAVAYALIANGYERVVNFSGGFEQLL